MNNSNSPLSALSFNLSPLQLKINHFLLCNWWNVVLLILTLISHVEGLELYYLVFLLDFYLAMSYTCKLCVILFLLATKTPNLNVVGEIRQKPHKDCNSPISSDHLNSTTCKLPQRYNVEIGKCVDQETYKRIASKPKCKNITLHENSFTILEYGFLKVNRSDKLFSPREYVLENSEATLCFPFSSQFLQCLWWQLRENEFEIQNEGLTLWNRAHNILLENGEFYLFGPKNLPMVCMSNSSLSGTQQFKEWRRVMHIYSSAWTVSAVSLAISLIIYFILHRNMKRHTKILICHMISLFIFYAILIFRAWGPNLTAEACVPFAFSVNYFFLAAFFWLNILSYDIWKNLPRFSNQRTFTSKKYQFMFMSIYAWGCPLVIAVVALLVDLFAPNGLAIKSNFSQNCWFETMESKLIFMYGPASFLMIANIVFFVLTVCNLRKLGNDASFVNKKIHNQLLRMYIKLTVVMGLCWTMEVISGVMEFNSYWYLPDIINGLQGFLIFLVYVCKKSVLRELVALCENNMTICSGICSKICRRRRSLPVPTSLTETTNVVQDRSSILSILPSNEYVVNSISLADSDLRKNV